MTKQRLEQLAACSSLHSAEEDITLGEVSSVALELIRAHKLLRRLIDSREYKLYITDETRFGKEVLEALTFAP